MIARFEREKRFCEHAKLKSIDPYYFENWDDVLGEEFDGDESEDNWAEAMHSFILGKVCKAGSYEIFQKNWLAILDSGVVPDLDLNLAAERLLGLLRAENASLPFDAVYILTHPEVLCLRKNLIEDRA